MKFNELASDYIPAYKGSGIVVAHTREHDGCVTFDLTDGTYWLSDENDTYQLEESLVFHDIVWIEDHGWAILNDDGSHTEIAWKE